MYAASTTSAANTISSYARKMAPASRPDLDIILDHHQHHNDGHGNDTTYTTFDAITGHVEITAPLNVRFDEILITLEGVSKTLVENLTPTPTARSSIVAKQTFLRLVMPLRDADYPQPRIAEAGRTYSFPFNFVVPEQLLPRACTHKCASPDVHQAHLQLPPTMGDREVSPRDDLTPYTTRVQYAIEVKVIRNREQDGKNVVLADGQRKLRIIPAVPEAPPVSIVAGEASDFVLSKTKLLKKGMFSGKLGRITVSALQPAAVMLPPPSSANPSPASTVTTVDLRFDPHHAASQPPRLGGLTTRINATTFYASRGSQSLPTRFGMHQIFETTRGIYETRVTLSSRCVENVAWTKHAAAPAYERRGSESSTSSSSSSDTPSPAANTPASSTSSPDHTSNLTPYYTAQILLPLALPASKTWLPSFHACIISRIYTLELKLSIHTPRAGVPATTVSLSLPLQIGALANLASRPALTAAEAAEELANAEEYLRPRLIEVPNEELLGTSVLVHRTATPAPSELPPSYDDFVAAPERRLVVSPGRC